MDRSNLPLVSVCIPAYNHEKYVQEAIQSVIDQDYPRIELIVIDDGSKDSTWSKLEEFRPKCEQCFERVVMKHQQNAGTSATCERLLSMCHGKYFALIASDDKYLPNAFIKMIEVLESDDHIGLVLGKNIVVDSDSRQCYWTDNREIVYNPVHAQMKTLNDFMYKISGVSQNGPGFGKYEELVRVNHVANGYVIRMDCMRRITAFTGKVPLEDWWLHLQLSKITKFKYIDELTFAYRWHATNTMHDDKYMQRITDETRYYELCQTRKLANRRWVKAFNNFEFNNKIVLRIPKFVSVRKIETGDCFKYKMYLFGRYVATVFKKSV